MIKSWQTKLTTLSSFLAVVLAMAGPAWAQLVTAQKNSGNFIYKYNGDTVPTTGGGLGNTGYGEGSYPNVIAKLSLTTDGNILTTTPTSKFRQKTTAKMPSSALPGLLASLNRFEFDVADGASDVYMSIDANGKMYQAPGGVVVTIANNDGGLHSYRFAQPADSNQTDFWFDDIYVGTYTATAPYATSTRPTTCSGAIVQETTAAIRTATTRGVPTMVRRLAVPVDWAVPLRLSQPPPCCS
ncbi:MAG: hypothetical protein WD468_10135 [Pirellulales bacterium]